MKLSIYQLMSKLNHLDTFYRSNKNILFIEMKLAIYQLMSKLNHL